MGLDFNGANELAASLESLVQSLSDDVKRAITMKAAEPIKQEMAAAAPGSIGAAVKARAKNGKVTIGVHRSDWKGKEYYPPYVEFGHGGPAPAPPHPFIRPAFDANMETAYRALREELLNALDAGK